MAELPSATPASDLADPSALAELVAQSPKQVLEPTGPDGATLVGTDTKVPRAEAAASAAVPTQLGTDHRVGMLTAGDIEIQPLLSTPAIERAARAQIYWPLRQKCAGPDGQPPPPDAVTLTFSIRSDGTVDPASVTAEAGDKRFEPTADCVLREFSALPFRGPGAVLGSSARVIITWPSVD